MDITKVYLVEEQSCINGNCINNIIGVYSSLDKAQDAYEDSKYAAEKEFQPDESWYKDEYTLATNKYFEMMDNTVAPERYYQLQLEERPLIH